MLPTGKCSHREHVERGGIEPNRTMNKGNHSSEGKGGYNVKKNKRHSGHEDIYTHKVHDNQLLFTDTAVLQVSSWVKTKSQIERIIRQSFNTAVLGQIQQSMSTWSLCYTRHAIYMNVQTHFC